MQLSRRNLIGAFAAATWPLSPALAQTFPTRTVTLMCPWPPGGGADTQMRALAKGAAALLGQTVVVENRPGATGTLAAATIARARPDGYTLAQSHNAVLRQPFIAATPYDPARDFTYIIGVSDNPFGLVVRADSPWATFQDFLEHARQNADKVTIAVPGIGSPGHLVADQIATTQKLRWTTVPYKGTADSMQALNGGHVTAAAESTGWVSFVDAGRMRLLAVFGNRRLRKYPNVPTLKEVGVDVADFSPWGIVGPAGMDPAVARVLHDAFKKAMEEPEFVSLLATYAQEPLYMSGDAYRRYALEALPFQKSIVEKYGLKQS